MSLFLWLCFFITYLTLPLNLYWKQFVSTCDIVIIDSRMPRRSWSTNTFCANARRYRHQATPSHIFYLIHAFQGLLQHLFVCIAYFHWTFNYYLPWRSEYPAIEGRAGADLNCCPELLLTNATDFNFLAKLIYHSVHTTVVAAQSHVNRFICRKHTEDLCRIFGYIISLRLLNSLLFQDLRPFLDTIYSIWMSFLIETNLKSPKTNHLYKHFETLTSWVRVSFITNQISFTMLHSSHKTVKRFAYL